MSWVTLTWHMCPTPSSHPTQSFHPVQPSFSLSPIIEENRRELKRKENFRLTPADNSIQAPPEDSQRLSNTKKELPKPSKQVKLDRRYVPAEYMEFSEAHATQAEQKSHPHSLGMRQLLAQGPSTIRPRANKMCKYPKLKISPKPSETHRSKPSK